jgi:type IV secretory pathway TrbF-like protein
MKSRSAYAAGDELSTPYKRAAQEWDDRIGSARVQAHSWRIMAMTCATCLIAAIGGMVYLGSKPKTVPYVVEVDKLGQATARGPADPAWKPSDVYIRFHLQHFVASVRRVSADPAVTKQGWMDAYAFASRRGQNMLSAYLKPLGQPIERAALGTVSVEILAALKITAGSWQVDWREHAWDASGKPDRDTTWRGTFRVYIHTPTDDEVQKKNPIGLYVDEFNWVKLRG